MKDIMMCKCCLQNFYKRHRFVEDFETDKVNGLHTNNIRQYFTFLEKEGTGNIATFNLDKELIGLCIDNVRFVLK